VGNQSQQLWALIENRYQSEHQQLSEMKSRSVLQRLRDAFGLQSLAVTET